MEQDYPTPQIEARILMNRFAGLNKRVPDEKETEMLMTMTKWSAAIREAYNKGAVNDIVSTRRLGSLLKSLYVFGRLDVAMNDILARFTPETRKAFIAFYNQLSTEQLKFGSDDSLTDGDDEA